MKTKKWDAAEHLRSEDDIAAYLGAALEDGDPALLEAALEDVERARRAIELGKSK